LYVTLIEVVVKHIKQHTIIMSIMFEGCVSPLAYISHPSIANFSQLACIGSFDLTTDFWIRPNQLTILMEKYESDRDSDVFEEIHSIFQGLSQYEKFTKKLIKLGFVDCLVRKLKACDIRAASTILRLLQGGKNATKILSSELIEAITFPSTYGWKKHSSSQLVELILAQDAQSGHYLSNILLLLSYGLNHKYCELGKSAWQKLTKANDPYISTTANQLLSRYAVEKMVLSQRKCDNCHTQGKKTKICKGCGVTRYCNVECQRRHWPKHQRVCLNQSICIHRVMKAQRMVVLMSVNKIMGLHYLTSNKDIMLTVIGRGLAPGRVMIHVSTQNFPYHAIFSAEEVQANDEFNATQKQIMKTDPNNLRQLTTHSKVYVVVMFLEGELTLVADLANHKYENIKKAK